MFWAIATHCQSSPVSRVSMCSGHLCTLGTVVSMVTLVVSYACPLRTSGTTTPTAHCVTHSFCKHSSVVQCAISSCCLHVCWRMFVCVHLIYSQQLYQDILIKAVELKAVNCVFCLCCFWESKLWKPTFSRLPDY